MARRVAMVSAVPSREKHPAVSPSSTFRSASGSEGDRRRKVGKHVPQQKRLVNGDQSVGSTASAVVHHQGGDGGSSVGSRPALTSRIRTTKGRIHEYLNSVDAEPDSTLRPTEAQLRWALLKKGNRAQTTREKVDALMQYPRSVSDVEGARRSDGETTEESCSSSSEEEEESTAKPAKISPANGARCTPRKNEARERYLRKIKGSSQTPNKLSPSGTSMGPVRRSAQSFKNGTSGGKKARRRRRKKVSKVPISNGRRALLRVSARATEARRHADATQSVNGGSDEISRVAWNRYESDNVEKPQHAEEDIIGDDVSVWTNNTACSARSHRSNRRRGRSCSRKRNAPASRAIVSNDDDDEERVRRFEEAYHVMMLSTTQVVASADGNPGDEVAMTSGKRWTRGSHVPVAVSIDGRTYDDLQRTPTVAHRTVSTPMYAGVDGASPTELQDRTASWMVHLPRNSKMKHRRQEGLIAADVVAGRGPPAMLSPGQQKFNDIVETLQQSGSPDAIDSNRTVGSPHTDPLHMKFTSQQNKDDYGTHPQTLHAETEIDPSNKGASSLRKISPAIMCGAAFAEGMSQFSVSEMKQITSHEGIGCAPVGKVDGGKRSEPPAPASRKQLRPVQCEEEAVKVNQNGFTLGNLGVDVKGLRSIFSPAKKETDDFYATNTSHAQRNKLSEQLKPTSSLSPAGKGTDVLMEPVDTENAAVSPDFMEPRRKSKEPDSASPAHQNSKSQANSLSPEQIRSINESVIKNSLSSREGDVGQTIIDTDGTTSDVSDPNTGNNFGMMGSLMLSPTILTKRHRQAIRAIELQNWDQVAYLLSANPWLAEMTDLRNNRYLLHELALYGAGGDFHIESSDENVESIHRAAPEKLNSDLIQTFPSSVHKFDNEGNLPLHMAAVSSNIPMIRDLGERFRSGASVQNHDGMLPLHLSIMSSATLPSGQLAVKLIIGLFPGSVAVCDNDGNLPLHLAASSLRGDVGVEIIYLLLDEAAKQGRVGLRLSSDVRGNVRSPKHMEEEESVGTVTTAPSSPLNADFDAGIVACNLVKNSHGQTPLIKAIQSMAGWQVIEALVSGSGGVQAAIEMDTSMCNSLHYLVSKEYADPAAVSSILKAVPDIASIPNGKGVLPIEAACMNSMPREVILALALVDLPIDLEIKDDAVVREGFGGSWWFLVCECDDEYVGIVCEILSICSYHQARALCFMRGGSDQNSGTAISRATPKCKAELRKALRFVGRYEFMGSAAIHTDPSKGLKVFDALDFNADDGQTKEGRRVFLKCYGQEEPFLREIELSGKVHFDTTYVEKMDHFRVHEFEAYSSANAPRQYCISIERPKLTLARVVAGMQQDQEYRHDAERFRRYLSKVSMVLRLIGKSIRHLHEKGVVHGDVGLHSCGKFGEKWKLMQLAGAKLEGETFSISHMGECSPPEAVYVEYDSHSREVRAAKFCKSLVVKPSVDIWAFGKLAYEVLVGEPLIHFDPKKKTRHDQLALISVGTWDEEDLRQVVGQLENAGIGPLGVDLVTHCLCALGEDRPQSMAEVLKHPFWKDTRRKTRSSAAASSRTSSGVRGTGKSDGRRFAA